jgi:hypothetical protein
VSREQWVEEAYGLLCKTQGEPAGESEQRNLRDWAEGIAQNYYDENPNDYTPEDAVQEELSYA